MKIFLHFIELVRFNPMSHTRTCITNGASLGLFFAFVPKSVKILTDIFSGYFFFEDSDGEYECPSP